MAYINFKEENFKARVQLKKRKENNKKLFNERLKDKKISEKYNLTEKWSYSFFGNETLGKSGVEREDNFVEISNKNIICSKFNNCTFENIRFKFCNFIGCYFIGCNFTGGGVIFEDCIFIKEESDKKPSLNIQENFSCEFINCNIYAKFLNSNIKYNIFENCTIKYTAFELTDMTSTIINDSELSMVVMQDVNISGAKILNTYIADFEFRDKDKSKIDEKTFFDKIPLREKNRDEYEGIYMVYETIADKFKENSLNNNFGEYYYICKCMQRKTLKPISRSASYLNWFVCGYGERPIYAINAAFAVILIFSFLYLITGIEIDDEIIKYGILNLKGLSFSEFITNFNESFNLSVGMFAGVGFNNAQPIACAYMIANIEMMLGVFLMGIGIGTLTKKFIR